MLWAGPPAAPGLYPKHPARLDNDAECRVSSNKILPFPNILHMTRLRFVDPAPDIFSFGLATYKASVAEAGR